ncbi:hypothetical protein GE061_012988 [Apolygus lucorum]|uniref:Uncharacterized protein n=1 Tax=Apolygus lucorum TaxID=248454 RepID=A0A8S9XXX9_APOLU|nr:hypothetical protein GE061_012988 [Apolygus lucorum]
MDEKMNIDNLSEHINIRDCTSKYVPINDDNYQKVINWFKSCLTLSRDLDPAQRDEYELNLISNVKSALSSFFQQTELSLSTLIELEKEMTEMFESLTPPSGTRAKSDQCDELKEPICQSASPNPPCSEIEDAMKVLFRKLMWIAIASLILLLLLILILSTLCWLRKCIAYEMKESFACCPSKEDTNEECEEDGRRRRSSDTTAYPVRVWLNPFAKRPPVQAKKQAKILGNDREKNRWEPK